MTDAIKKSPTSCRAYEIMCMMWCVGSQSSVSLASWFYLVTNHGFKFACIMSQVWDHAHQRMRSRSQTKKTVQPYNAQTNSSMLLTFLSPGLLHSTVPWLIIRNLFEIMDRHRTIIFMFCVWIQVHLRNVQDVRIQCHADELVCTIWWAMSHTFEHSGYPQVSKSLHAPCSAMRSTDDTCARCNQKTTCIMSCAWDHAHDVMRREPEQC